MNIIPKQYDKFKKLLKHLQAQYRNYSDMDGDVPNSSKPVFGLAMKNDILPSTVENFIACADAHVDIFARNQIPEQFCENIEQKYYIVQGGRC